VRSVLALLAGVLAVVGIVGAAVGLWAKSTVLDSARVAQTTYQVLGDEEVSDALAAKVVAEVSNAIGLSDLIDEYVPGLLQDRVEVVRAGIRATAEDRLGALIRTDDVRLLVATAVGRTHAAAVKVLEGEGLVDGVTVEDGEVTLNVLPLASRALLQLQDIGLLSQIDVPDLDRSDDADAQRAELSAALGRELPEEFGEIVVYRSDALAEAGGTVAAAQQLLVTLQRALWVLLVTGLVMAVVSVWLSRNRPRTVLIVASGILVLMIAVRLTMRAAVNRIPELLVDAGASSASEQVLRNLQESLANSTIAYVLLALFAIVIAWLVRPRTPATPAA
jgi:hypothetical protein